jgi:hypothetical protein
MLDNETVDGSEQNHDGAVENNTADYKSEVETLKQQNAEILSSLKALQQAQNQPKEAPQKTYTAEEFKALQESNPEAALEYVISKKLNASTSQIETKLSAQQQQVYYDNKAEQDFPLIKTDKKFSAEVQKEIRALVDAGMSKDSPKLVYTAAEIAALRYKGHENTKQSNNSSLTGESPSKVKTNATQKVDADDKTFKAFANAFGLSDKAKEIARRNIAMNSEAANHRKGRS